MNDDNDLLWIVFLFALAQVVLVALACTGCAGPDPSIREMQAATAEPTASPRIDSEGPVDVRTEQETDQRQQDTTANVAGDAERVTTQKFGLDAGTESLLQSFAEIVGDGVAQASRMLGRTIAAAAIVAVGAFLLAFFCDAPDNMEIKAIGVIIALSAMVAGPVLVFTLM